MTDGTRERDKAASPNLFDIDDRDIEMASSRCPSRASSRATGPPSSAADSGEDDVKSDDAGPTKSKARPSRPADDSDESEIELPTRRPAVKLKVSTLPCFLVLC